MTQMVEPRRLLTEVVSASADPDYWTHHDGGVYVSVPDGVLANDFGYDDSSSGGGSGATLTAALEDDVSNGTLDFHSDGSFTYTPDAGFVGEETFTYTASYGSATSDPTTVTITVVNEPPFVWNSSTDPFTVPHDQVLEAAAGTIQVNDMDDYLDLGMLTHSIVTDVEHGDLVFDDDGSFVYTPEDGYVGPDSFEVSYTDSIGEESNLLAVLINVIDKPPVANDDSGYFCLGNAGSTSADADNGVLKNDMDEDTPNENLTAEIVGQPEHGWVDLNSDGSFTYTLEDSTYIGPETFTYKARDATGAGNIAAVTIQVGQLRIKTQGDDSIDITNATQTHEAGIRARLIAEILNGEGVTANYTWSIGGQPVKNYDGRDVTDLTAQDLSSASVDWAWIIGPGMRDVSVTANVNGVTGSASTHYDVFLPAYNLTCSSSSVGFYSRDNGLKMTHSCGLLEDNDGSYGVSIPGVSINASPSDTDHLAQWVQILDSSKITKKVYLNGIDGLTKTMEATQSDKTDSVPGWQLLEDYWYDTDGNTLVDTPYSDIGNDVASYKREDKFTSYLYIRSDKVGDCPVPVAKVRWNWSGSVERVFGVLLMQPGHTDPVPQSSVFNQYPPIPMDYVINPPPFVVVP